MERPRTQCSIAWAALEQLFAAKKNVARNKLLIVDDEKVFRETLSAIFAAEFECHTANDGVEALEMVEDVAPDMILLDIRMPRMDGFQTCLRLRQNDKTRHIPIIFLTTHSEPQTESFGLDLGADDFVSKPFDPDVLRARVKKRMNGGRSGGTGERTNLEDYVILWDRQEATHGDEVIVLTTKEINLLRLFVQNAGRVLSRNVILEKVWADTYITDRSIDSHVKELRKEIPPLVKLLKTVYGSGYRLDI